VKTISRQEFRADPAAALKKAEEEGALTIVDENGAPRITVSGQASGIDREFVGVVKWERHVFELDHGTEIRLGAYDMFHDLVGKRIRITVEVLG
jgi:hypothetical protein